MIGPARTRPSLDELLARIPDRDRMTGPPLTSAVAAQEAREIFATITRAGEPTLVK